jgi:hypothetical protein
MNFSKFSKNALLAAGLVVAMSSCNKDMKDEISTTKGNVESNQAALAAQNEASEAEIAKQDSLRALDIATDLADDEAEAAEEAADLAANAGYTYSNDGVATVKAEGFDTNGERYSTQLTLGVTNKAGNTYQVEERSYDGEYYDYDENEWVDLEYTYTEETWTVTLWSNEGSSARDLDFQSNVSVTISRNSNLQGSTESELDDANRNLYLNEARIDYGSYNLKEDDGFYYNRAQGSINQSGCSTCYGYELGSDFNYVESSKAITFDLYSVNETGNSIELEIEVSSTILRENVDSYRIK